MHALQMRLVALTSVLLFASLVIGSIGENEVKANDPAMKKPAEKTLLLLSSAPDGHAKGTHEYQQCLDDLQGLLRSQGEVQVRHVQVSDQWDSGLEELKQADGVVLFLSEGGRWITADPRREQAFLDFAGQGRGVMAIHWATGTKETAPIPTLLKLLGACHGGPDRKYRVMEGELKIASPEHPVVRGIKPFTIRDEFYYQLKTGSQPIQPLVTVSIDNQDYPVVWAWKRDALENAQAGRSVGFIGGHYQSGWQHPAYQRLLCQAAYWIVHETIAEKATLHLTIEDETTKLPTAARVYLQGADGTWHFPISTSSKGSALRYEKARADGSTEMHATVSAHPIRFDVPFGKYTLLVERGTEYIPHEQVIELSEEQSLVSKKVTMQRWIYMAKRGWFSGDTHIHRSLAEVPNLVLAEDINIAFPLSHWVTTADRDAIAGNNIRDPQTRPQVLTVAPQHLIYPLNTEYEIFTVNGKPHTLGAFVGIGHKEPLPFAAPPLTKIAEAIHAQGGLIDLEKHSWPWSVAIVPIMKADLFELSNNHCWRTKFALRDWTVAAADEYMQLEKEPGGLTEWGWIDFGFQTYYALLNCGFEISPTAGTGQGVHPVPMGFSRVYVQPEGEFSYESWLRGLKAGRSFVTTGPMLEVTMSDKLPGATLTLPKEEASSKLLLYGTVETLHPLDRVEYVDNGEVTKLAIMNSQSNGQGGWKSAFQHEVNASEAGWIAVRAFEKHPEGKIRFAHTAPFYLQKEGSKVLPTKVQIGYLVRRCREEVERNRGVVSAESLAEYQSALDFYEAIAKQVADKAR